MVCWYGGGSKKGKTVRICVDLKPLNTSALRETHPLPKIDDTLAQLTGAKVFSKLDANSGFWQIPLAEKSRRLSTFITLFGRFYFNRCLLEFLVHLSTFRNE